MNRWAVAGLGFACGGIGSWSYAITGYVIPKLLYELLCRLPWWRLRRIVIGSAAAGAVSGFLLASFLWSAMTAAAILLVLGGLASLAVTAARRFHRARLRRRARLLTEMARKESSKETFTLLDDLPLAASTREAIERTRQASVDQELVIGHIDNDGRVLGLFGELPGLESIDEEHFVGRYRYPLDIVLTGNRVLVRKDFRGDRAGFVREWYNLATLSGKVNSPALYRVDEERCHIYKNLILGRTVREVLVGAGAEILNAQTDDDPELASLAGWRYEAVWERGRSLIPFCLSEDFLLELENQLDRLHHCGVVGASLTFGNVILGSRDGAPWFIDFDNARVYRSSSSLLFVFRRDEDRVKFKKLYGRDLVTQCSARAALKARNGENPAWCPPVDFGNGVSVGRFRAVRRAMREWEALARDVMRPLVAGRRVLELGSTNVLTPLMILRSGASEVLRVEPSPRNAESVRFAQRLCEWRDMRKYNLRIQEGDVLEVLRGEPGKFDVVTASCSRSLQPEKIARVMRRASELAPVMMLEGQTVSPEEAADGEAMKSSISFLRDILERNGFPQIEVVSTPGGSRSLLVGRSRPNRP